ncbi:hypothetical protein N0V82_008762 [Gnomoniopsis sp. IMI 355080]|nr:hypothetical protein N0V82_008762 [Gnomoniopsis sp. IMI 355080]
MFREIHLTVHDSASLQRDVDTLIEKLTHGDSARYVRCLNVKGFLRVGVELPSTSRYQTRTLDDMSYFEECGIDEILEGEEPMFPMGGLHYSHSEAIIERSSEEDMAWIPVVNLIKRLPGLTTLVYDCRNQFPPSLLDAVHEHPFCKLKHLTFRLRSLLRDVPDPYEMALATSPALYSVRVRCAWRDSNGDDDFNHEAMLELVAGLTPNLKEVVVHYASPYMRNVHYRRPRGTWRGLPGFVPGKCVGSLTSLSLLGSVDWWTTDVITGWAKHTDFGRLRHLDLGGGYDETFGPGMREEVMQWVVENCSFPRLKTLRAHLSRDDRMVERPDYADTAVAFFKLFEPLDEIIVCGALEAKILDAILTQHGPTLQKLSLRPTEISTSVSNGNKRMKIPMVFEKEHISQIQTQCPALQNLSISVKRTKSDAREAEIYKAFGKMEHLQVLFLTLDCSDYRVTRDSTRTDDPSFDEFDREFGWGLGFLQLGHVRETYMNCAVDETLACSIWDTICRAKVGKPLQSLKLWTTGGDEWGNGTSNGGIRPVVDKLSRSWLLERVVGMEDMITVKELGRQRRERGEKDWNESSNPESDTYHRKGRKGEKEWSLVRQIFHRVWPPKKDSKDWGEEWESLPLQI